MRLDRLVCAWIVVSAGVANADPEARLAELLARGRAADARGDHAAAAHELEAARALAPTDGAVLAELGWVYFEAKDAARAEATTRDAIAHLPLTVDDPFRVDPTNRLRGAALYNLGQIREGGGDGRGAVAAYVESLRARANAVVAARLRALDAAAADAADPLRPTVMEGPFASISAFCASVAAPEGDVGATCRCGEVLPRPGRARQPAGVAEVVAFPRHGCADHTEQELDIAVRRGDAWFVARVGTGAINDGSGHCGPAEFALLGATAPIRGVTVVEYRSRGSCNHLASDWGWDHQLAVAIGVGPGGVPAASPAIPLRLVEDDGGHTGGRTTAAWTLTWAAGATVTIAGTLAATALVLGGDLRGAHHLAFP